MDGGVRVGVVQLDGQLFNLRAYAHLLHAVTHVNLDIFRQLVDQQVPLVPHLQGVVTEDVCLTDVLVQVPDVGENGVHRIHVCLEHRHSVVVLFLQAPAVRLQEVGQRLAGGLHLNVVLVVARIALQIVQSAEYFPELSGDDAELLALGKLAALADLVQNSGDAVQTFQQGVHGTHIGALGAVLDIQIGIPELGQAVAQNALAYLHAGGGVITVRAGVVKALLIQPLPGIARCVDVGNIVTRNCQAGLGGVNRQAGLRKGTKCTDTHNNLHAPHGAKFEIRPGGPL